MTDNNRTQFAALLTALLLLSTTAHAADWLTLQGTESPANTERAKIWGFIQPQYQTTSGSELSAGPFAGEKAAFNQIAPKRESDSQFQLRRARIGARGTPFSKDPDVNYFLLVELGSNGITELGDGDGQARVSDASVTLNHLKEFTRVRIGQFKTPTAEDGLQAIHVHNYIDFATPTDQLLQERFFDRDGTAPNDENSPNGPVGAFRDVGIQFFNTFTQEEGPMGTPWELSYAFMIGNGNGIARGDNNSAKDTYAYLAAGPVFGGKGGRRQDAKLFAWHQSGERTLENSNGEEEDFDRTRWGLGLTFRKDPWRFAAEYYAADGMIFNGTDGGAVAGTEVVTAGADGLLGTADDGSRVAGFNVLPENEAHGYYLDVGYKLLPNLELDYRYAYLDRGTEGAASIEREFTDHTIGLQYFINRKVRAILNYQFRDAEAPGLDGNAVPNQILDEMDDVISAQILAVF